MVDYYTLKVGNVKRTLPIVSLGPKVKVASVNLLGDVELVDALVKEISKKIKNVDFDYLVGPEVKVVPLLHELTKELKRNKYVVCRKRIHAYMQRPLKASQKTGLVINGTDAELLYGKKVIIVDDVVSTGSTIYQVEKLMKLAKSDVVKKVALFRQGDRLHELQGDLLYLQELPVFGT